MSWQGVSKHPSSICSSLCCLHSSLSSRQIQACIPELCNSYAAALCRQHKRKYEASPEVRQQPASQECIRCGAKSSPQWQPEVLAGRKVLFNACGVKLLYSHKAKKGKPNNNISAAVGHQPHPDIAAKRSKRSKRLHQQSNESSRVRSALQATAAAPQHMQSKPGVSPAQCGAGDSAMHTSGICIDGNFSLSAACQGRQDNSTAVPSSMRHSRNSSCTSQEFAQV